MKGEWYYKPGSLVSRAIHLRPTVNGEWHSKVGVSLKRGVLFGEHSNPFTHSCKRVSVIENRGLKLTGVKRAFHLHTTSKGMFLNGLTREWRLLYGG